MACLIGIDSGLTVTKACVFDEDGRLLSVSRRRVPQSMPAPRFVERDMDGLWRASAEAITQALADSGRPASDVACVAATAHGDGLYLLDGETRPLGPAILSLDSRAGQLVDSWKGGTIPAEALRLTGQEPHASAPSALLAWMKEHQPERFGRIAHLMACKDWLTFCLTGRIGTDRTEASTSFTAVAHQDYDRDALAIYGLEGLWDALPPMARPDEVIGRVTAQAARLTGLAEGTPVAAGLHDVTASALGIGGLSRGVVAIIAGTYSINETLSDRPVTDPRWFCRNAIEPGIWNNMSISPASTANYDWFIDTLAAVERDREEAAGRSIHDLLAPAIEAALARPSTAFFHPYLFGSPHGAAASAGFSGLRGWQDRADMLRAVLEGIAFNHRNHVDALADGFSFSEARLTGGISRSPLAAQMFADVLAMPVTVTATEEAAAWGAALCAGAAVGLYAAPDADPRDLEPLTTRYRPDPVRAARYQRRYGVYNEIAAAMAPVWPSIEAMAAEDS